MFGSFQCLQKSKLFFFINENLKCFTSSSGVVVVSKGQRVLLLGGSSSSVFQRKKNVHTHVSVVQREWRWYCFQQRAGKGCVHGGGPAGVCSSSVCQQVNSPFI